MKKFLALILASILVLALSACEQIDNTSSVSNTSAPSQTVTESIGSDTSSDTSTESTESVESTTSATDENTSTNETSSAADTSTVNDCATLGHNFTESRVESTCSSKGHIKRVCSRCGKSTTDYLNLKEHTYTKNYQSVSNAQHNAYFTCSVCNYSYTEISAHSWSAWTTTKDATQSAAGEKTRQCTICNHKETQTIPQLPSSTEDRNARVLELVNIEREKAGLKPLEYYYAGQSAADIRAAEIIESFSHTRPDGSSCFTVFDEFNINYRSVGENIAYGYSTPEAVVEGWMNSEGHRANILNPSFTHLIVGYNNNHWVQLFIGI
ncbi:MAG: hypothetical protein IJY79_07855 [Clostridia bacterium]|nr:hypothetical protein [Clostridia bacterium]